MHEISIIESVLDIAEEEARRVSAPSIHVIKLRLGQFTVIAREALEFAFDIARHGTLAEHARLEIEMAPMIVHCVVCGIDAEPAGMINLVCVQCGFPLQIVSGQELQIDYIEVADCAIIPSVVGLNEF
jgi:hydrogenase nickel incorporation protein HypA/HybF